MNDADVIVIGGGNAGFCAALAARENGRSVILLERGSVEESGGNSYFTAGATRIAHEGFRDLESLVQVDARNSMAVVPPYPEAEFAADMDRVTGGRNDSAMTGVLVSESQDTVRWLVAHGMRYRLMYERQAYRRDDGTHLFWGGLHIGNVGGGVGLIDDHVRIARAAGVEVRYGHRVTDFVTTAGAVTGVRFVAPGESDGELAADSVVVASGGFEANADLRELHLGPGWAHAKVRGTPLNTGELLLAAIDVGAARGGDWSSCHSVQWDAYAPGNESNRELTNRLTRQSYPLGILVNRDGRRFLDEGADFRNYTYSKYGREVLAQPGSVAWQVFDAELRPLLREEEYEMPGISVDTAESLAELAEVAGIDAEKFVANVDAFNASIDRDVPLDPTIKDGRNAPVEPPKSNWAAPIERPPFYAYAVTCGITFTFGGLKADLTGRVQRDDGSTISGLFACGEALGGLFSGNYPGGSGLTAGMVFGRRAGSAA